MFTILKKSARDLLLLLQRYTRTDMVYLTRNGFWVMLSYIIQISVGIITTVALANLLPKETLGTYQFLLAVAAVLSVMTLSGMHQAVVRAVAQGNEGILRSGLRIKLKWNLWIVVASGLVALYYFVSGNSDLGIAFLIVGTFAPFIEGFKLAHSFLIGKEAFKDTVTLGAWRKPLPFIAVLATVFFTDNFLILVFAYFVSHAISYIAVYLAVVRKYRPPYTEDAEAIHYSKQLSALRIAGTLSNNLEKILLWHFLGAAAVASFAIAQFAIRYFGGALNTLTLQVLPKASRRDLPTLQQTLPRKVNLLTLLTAAGALLYILIAPFVFPFIFPTYPESVVLSQVLAIGLILIPRSVYAQVFTAHKQIRAQYIMGFGTPIVKSILLVAGIQLYGIWGVVYALLLTDAVASVVIRYLFSTAAVPPPHEEQS